MTSTTNFDTSAQQEVRKHPIRGAIWGFFLGLGVAIYLVLFAVIAFGDWVPFGICIAAGIVLGIGWASIAPAKQPKGPPPAQRVAATAGTTGTVAEPVADQVSDVTAPPAPPSSAATSFDPTPPDDTPPGGQLEQILDDLGAKPSDPNVDDLPPPPPPAPTA